MNQKLLVVAFGSWLAGCASSSPGADAEAGPTARAEETGCPEQSGLCFDVLPEDAAIEVDGEGRGTVASLGPAGKRFLALEPGLHRVILRAEGYATWRAEVAIAESAERVEIELQPQGE